MPRLPSLPRTPRIRPRWMREGVIPLSSGQSLYEVELKLSSRTCLAHQTQGDACLTRREVYCQSTPSALLTEGGRELLEKRVPGATPCRTRTAAVRRSRDH